MDYASKDYGANAYGASYVKQYLEKGRRDKDKAAENKENVEIGCEKGKPCAATSGGDGPSRQSNEGSGSTVAKKSAGGAKNEVLNPKQAAKRAAEFEEMRRKASDRSKF